jgi:hypothetical protein
MRLWYIASSFINTTMFEGIYMLPDFNHYTVYMHVLRHHKS